MLIFQSSQRHKDGDEEQARVRRDGVKISGGKEEEGHQITTQYQRRVTENEKEKKKGKSRRGLYANCEEKTDMG